MIVYVDNSVTERLLLSLQFKHSRLIPSALRDVVTFATARECLAFLEHNSHDVSCLICDYMLDTVDLPFRDLLVLACGNLGIPLCIYTALSDETLVESVPVFRKVNNPELSISFMEWLTGAGASQKELIRGK